MASTSSNTHEVPGCSTSRDRSRSHSEGSENEGIKQSCSSFLKMLQCNRSVTASDESVMSMQELETDVPHDTPFTDTVSSSEYESSEVPEIEYEYASESNPVSSISDISSGNEPTLAGGAFADGFSDKSSNHYFTDREEDFDMGFPERIGLKTTEWSCCTKCNNINSNSSYRYCHDCYQKRRDFFPPRPKGFKKRSELEDKIKRKRKTVVSSQDSGVVTFDSAKDPKRRKLSNTDDEEQEGLKKNHTTVVRSNNNLPDSENYRIPELNTSTKDKLSCNEKTDIIEGPHGLENDTKKLDTTLQNNTESNRTSIEITKELCMMCATVVKDSIFLHGTTAHLGCCYPCAFRTWKTTKCCPVCKQKVRNVVKIYA